MKITIERIKKQVTAEIFRRGEKYFLQRRAKLITVELDHFEAEVQGAVPYQVSVQEIGESLFSSCSCPYWTTCKHIVAAMLEAKQWYDENRAELLNARTHPSWKKFFAKAVPELNSRRPNQQWRVLYLLELNQESWSLTPLKAYVKRNRFFGRLSPVGEFDLDSSEMVYAPNDPIIVSHLQKIERQNYSFFSSRFFGNRRYFEANVFHYRYGSRLGPLFDLLRDSLIYLAPYEDQLAPLSFHPQHVTVELSFEKLGDDYRFAPYVRYGDQREPLDVSYKILTSAPIWLYKANRFFKVDNMQEASLLVPFTKNNITLDIPEAELPAFLEETFPRLRQLAPLTLPAALPLTRVDRLTDKKLFLRENERHLEVDLKFGYGGFDIDADDTTMICYRQAGGTFFEIHRDADAEAQAVNRLLESGLKQDPKGGLRVIDSKALNWLFKHLPELANDGFTFFGREALTRFNVRTGTPNVRVAVSSNIDWFDVNIEIDVEGIKLPLKELRRAIRQNSRLVKLADQSIAQLPEEWFVRFQRLFNFTAVEEQGVKASRLQLSLIDMLFQQAASFETDQAFQQQLRRLTAFSEIEPQPLPTTLQPVLRNYQKAGYDWLNFLKEYSFGGCLADDMGLGKTVQTLAVLLHDKLNGNRTPSLIVCPTSVVFNWEREVQKFTPELRLRQHVGLSRRRSSDEFENYDIILTTYGIMRRDILLLKDYLFHYVILDESQKIKNPQSQTAKAARLLNARHRLVLTGTPVENNTVELWSQFAFLNPGLLGQIGYFKSAFTLPIEKYRDEETAQFLRRLIYPFILRRTKEGVAKELPPKIEQTHFCPMNPAQERLYFHWRDYYRAQILERIDAAGIEASHMNVLEGLVKLRQIACHPHLVEPSITEDSGKFEMLKELVEEILAENHKVLIFSQFVRMLRLIRGHLDEQGIIYEYLDGHTVNRRERVERFQRDEGVRIFLISLKAGGVGLNLTAADYVIHYDPWWNPAVEVQATDRAHRIGQHKKVFVYRLITKGSVEEKMLELQARKRKLVSDLISTDSSFFKSLTRDDIEVLFS